MADKDHDTSPDTSRQARAGLRTLPHGPLPARVRASPVELDPRATRLAGWDEDESDPRGAEGEGDRAPSTDEQGTAGNGRSAASPSLGGDGSEPAPQEAHREAVDAETAEPLDAVAAQPAEPVEEDEAVEEVDGDPAVVAEADEPEPSREEPEEPHASAEDPPATATGLEPVQADDGDDPVHFDVAARALKVSRRTVERMVKRGELDRAASAGTGGAASVTKRSLVKVLEGRRETLPDEVEIVGSSPVPAAPPAVAPSAAPAPSSEVPPELADVLDALLGQVVEARSSSVLLEERVRALEAGTGQPAGTLPDELLVDLLGGSWRERRRARRELLARLVRRPASGGPPAPPG